MMAIGFNLILFILCFSGLGKGGKGVEYIIFISIQVIAIAIISLFLKQLNEFEKAKQPFANPKMREAIFNIERRVLVYIIKFGTLFILLRDGKFIVAGISAIAIILLAIYQKKLKINLIKYGEKKYE